MSDVLQGSGRAGDFVHANQVMGTADGFKNVSKLWVDQTITFDAGLEVMAKEAAEREDINANLADTVIKIDDKGICVMVDGRVFHPTPHALLHLATWLDVPHTMVNWYTNPKVKPNGETRITRDEKDTELVVLALRNGLRRAGDRVNLFRTYKDGTLRAVLSDIYGIIDNRWYVETLKELLPSGRLSHWRGGADTIYGNVLIPDSVREETDSDYGGMISISNCEIGLRRMAQYPSVFRAICMNGCIWDQTKGNILNKVHRGEIVLADLRVAILENVNKQIPLLASGVDKFLALRSREINKETHRLSQVFAQIALDNSFSAGQAQATLQEWLANEKESRNAFGVVNAITRAGQKFDNATWVDFDNVAGNLMNMTDNQWSRLLAESTEVDDKVLEKLYGVAV